MTSYMIIDPASVRLYRGGFADSRAIAEHLCGRNPELIVKQVRFRGGEKWGQVVFEYSKRLSSVVPPYLYLGFDIRNL